MTIMRKSQLLVLSLIASSLSCLAQTTTPPVAFLAYINPGSGATPLVGSFAGAPIITPPEPRLIYVTDGNGHYGPWTGPSGGAPTTCTSGNNYACLNTANAFTANQAINATTGNPLVITDSDAVSGNIFMNTMNATAPASGANIIDELGKNENNGGLWRIAHYVGLNNGGNYYMHLTRGGSIPGYAMILINNHTIINGSTDAGYMLDVIGSERATSVTSAIFLTPNTFVGRSQTTALNQTIIASAATATYRISMATNCATAVAAASYTSTVSYRDTSNTLQTIASGVITCTTLGTTTQSNAITVANVLTGTPISLATTVSGAVSYDVAVTVEKITSN